MDAVQQKILIIALSSFLIGFSLWIILLRNFTINWLKVKMSGGKKILIKVVSILGDYYVAGAYNKEHLEFIARARKDNKDPGRCIWVNPEHEGIAFYSQFGVKCVDVDDAKDCVYFRHDKEYKKVPPVNTEYYDELQKTALAKPSEEGIGFFNAKTWQVIVIMGILLCAGLAVFIYKDVKTVKDRQALLHDEHVSIAYEINQTRIDLQKVLPYIQKDNAGTGISLTGGGK